MNVLDALITHFGAENVVGRSGRRVKIRCPYHAGGMEKTPSCVVNIEEPYLGYFTCMACNEHGDLSKLIGGEIEQDFSIHLDKSILKETINPVNTEWESWPKWPKDKVWRTIPGWLVCKVGGRIETTEYGKRLALPVIQHGKCQGLIHCTFKKSKLSYINDSHPFSRTSFYLHDYALRLLRKSKTKTLFVVEGPRDALRLASVGLPAFSNIGGVTVFTEYKAQLIIDASPNQLIIATDPDKIGNLLAELIYEQCPGIKKRRLHLNVKYDDAGKVVFKEDPGNMSEIRLQWLAKHFS